MTENIYSCFHYHEKCKKDREATEKAASEAKGYADSINPATLVNIGSDQTINGRKTFTKPITARMNTVEENTPPAQSQYIDWIAPLDKNGLGIGYLGVADYADGRRSSRIGHTRTKSDGSKVYASIDVGTDKNGTVYTSAPNPPSGSNGTYIATTSWVNSRMGSQGLFCITSISGRNWSREWKDSSGNRVWLEQGGHVGDGQTNVNTLTFPKPFTNKDYTFIRDIFIYASTGNSPAWNEFTYTNKTTTGLKFYKTSPVIQLDWYACGK